MNDNFIHKFYNKDFPHFEKFKQLVSAEYKEEYSRWKNSPDDFLYNDTVNSGTLAEVLSITPEEFKDMDVTFVSFDVGDINDKDSFDVWYLINDIDCYFSSYDSQWFRIPDYLGISSEKITFYDHKNIENIENNENNENIKNNENNEIEIDLHPNDAPLFVLGYKSDLLVSYGEIKNHEIQIRDITLNVEEEIETTSYTLTRDNCVIAGFEEDGCSFQLGDCSKRVFIYNETDIIIVNGGDVRSTVVFHNCFPKILQN